jgi:hypothetical protein
LRIGVPLGGELPLRPARNNCGGAPAVRKVNVNNLIRKVARMFHDIQEREFDKAVDAVISAATP